LSQQALLDTSFLAASKKKLVTKYTESIQRQSRLYNGTDYIVYFTKYDEHPYFTSDDWVFGSVLYWGELYENVPLMYDLTIDELITEHARGNPIRLIAQKIESFKISEHTFVRLRPDDKNKIAEGFYDRLYDGMSKVYAKYHKNFRETLEEKEVIPHFDEITRYYVFKDGVLHNVRTKASVLQVFEDRKQELKAFLRKSRLNFKSSRDVAIARAAEFYDSLTD
jgi:hypothetical protein